MDTIQIQFKKPWPDLFAIYAEEWAARGAWLGATVISNLDSVPTSDSDT
jgi:hypothetical protein